MELIQKYWLKEIYKLQAKEVQSFLIITVQGLLQINPLRIQLSNIFSKYPYLNLTHQSQLILPNIMGSYLQTISQVHHQQPSVFHQKIANVSEPIQKIKQYYGLFKSVCDSFLITKEKYTQIFQSTKNLQEVWDREKNNKIDALQLFTGLIAFSSQSTFRQKIKFWFIMFDFNQVKNISFVDLQYLTICICNATFKVLDKNVKANQSQIVSWLKHDFSEKQRINITKLYAFCIQCPQVKKFFQLTTKEPNNSVCLKDFIEAEKNLKKLNRPLTNTIPYIKESKNELQDKLQWHRQFSKKISTPYNPTTFLHTSKLSWVYGMRVQGLQKPFQLISTSDKTTKSEQLLYCTSTLMILYNIKTNKQRYYRGHSRIISSFVYNKSKRVVISSSDSLCNKSIHVWSYDTLECIKIIDTYKPVKSLTLLGKHEEMLIVVCGESQVKHCIGSEVQKSTIMIFSLEQRLNYALVYSYTYDYLIKEIVNTYTNIDEQEVIINIWNAFVVVCENTPTVIFSQFEFQIHSTESGNTWTSNLKTTAYEFYDDHDSVQKLNTESPKHKNKITCCIALYINEENPCLRSFITNEDSLSLCIITGHQNGQIKCVYYSQGQFNSEDLILQEVSGNTPRIAHKPIVQSNPHQSGFPQTNQQLTESPVTCLKHTGSHIIFSHSSFITIMPFSFLVNKQQTHLRTINIVNYHDLRLFNSQINYFALSQNQLIMVTENEGDFISIDNRRILFNDPSFVEKQMIKKIKTLTKIQSNANSTMCLLQKVQTEHLVYVTTQDRKILIINSFSKQVENVWEINSPGDHITAIDTVYTDEDVLYFVCGCKEGKLYIRVDNEQNPKFYDCVSEIIDVKISKDASYLLVATAEKYLYFFTQINKNFSSPRKMHFENQIPICMNFLDSNKMFTVNTSAKNVYTIQIPQLKYKNVQKQSEKINISKMKIMHPSASSSYGTGLKQQKSNKKQKKDSPYIQQSEKGLVYTKSYLGGELKYFLMTMHNGELLFFQNRYHMSKLSYVRLQAHWGQISAITMVEGQEKFYSLGRHDNTLLEWQTQSIRTLTNVPQSVRLYSEKVSAYDQEEFQKMREMSFYYKLLNYSKPDDIYLFRGTHHEKLNEALKKSLSDLVVGENQIPNQEESFESANVISSKKNIPHLSKAKLNLRQPNLSLDMAYVFGIDCYKRSSVIFWKQNQHQNTDSILYHSSRFLLSLELSQNKKQQHVLQQQKYKISCFVITENQQILYALTEPNPKIRIHASDQTLHTTHEFGIIHFTAYKNYVLSYGILKNTYSINLHNYKTGQLISKRTTQLAIHEFIFINKSQMISLNEIRIWKDLYPTEKIGRATAGILMPNNSDVCIATDNGSISILNTKKGIFTVVTKAHQSDIIGMKLNKLEGNEFELLTVSKDDKIKIWNQKFNCKLVINLRDELLKSIKYLVETEDKGRGFSVDLKKVSKQTFGGQQSVSNYRILNIRGIDFRKGKILMYLSTGQVYVGKFTLINRKNELERGDLQEREEERSEYEASILSESNESIFVQMQKNQNSSGGMNYENQWEKVIESHSCETNTIFKKFINFAVHPEFPIVVSVGGNDRKLLFRNYETCEILDTYYCEQSRINCLKFSNRGKLLVMGFKNGTIKVYSLQVNHKQNMIRGLELHFSQKFVIKDSIRCEPISIQFSQKSIYFSVSFIGYRCKEQAQTANEQLTSQQQSAHKNVSFIKIYKQKHQYSQLSTSSEQTFYTLIDTLHIKQDQNSIFNSNKYIRCVYNMTFTYSIRNDLIGSKQKDIKSPVDIGDQSMCLVMYQQYVNENHIRLNHSQKDKFLVYVIEEKAFAKKEFQQIDWAQVCFPEMLNVLQLNRFKNQILFLNSEYNQQSEDTEPWKSDDSYTQIKQKFDQNPLSISSMCYYNRDFIICGGTHGKIHLIRLSSLIINKTDPLQQIRQQQMSISKTYVSQASFINCLQLSTDLKHLFVAGQLDECIVKYKVEELSAESDLDYQIYDTLQNDVTDTYMTKDKFYNFVNSIMPLRQQIKNILEDVQSFDQKNTNSLKQQPNLGLEIIKVVGRRAYDRFNNIYMNQQNLIYTIGPNLVIQNIMDTFNQKILPSDPNPLSYRPQISTIHMKPNSNLLILATEQQVSRLFVWDIRASICLSQVQVNCSVIYNIKLVGDCYAVFYGINSMYQLVIQVVDWKHKKIVALNNFLHSATWKIKDICPIELEDRPIEQNAIKFITCGVQHLSEWKIRSNTLIETHFTSIPPQSSFQVINHYKDEYIITGCEKGSIYLWKDRILVQQLKVQTGPIRSLQVIVQNCTIISGGIDSHVYICKLEEDDIYVQSSKSLNPKQQDINNNSNIEESMKGEKQKEGMKIQASTFLTQFDIQSIIYSPMIDMTKKYSSLPYFEECNFFVGTRSGDIYFCEYNFKEKEFISITHVVYGQDHETIVCTAFSDKEEILYTLTTSGKLQVWNLKIFQKIFTYKFMKKAKKLYVYNEFLLISFEKQIIFIELDIKDKIVKIEQSMTLTFDGVISECVLSFNQQYLAVGLHKNESNQIMIYELDKNNLIYHSPSFKYEIQFLDFSTDEKYLLYKDKFEQIGMIYLVTLKRINTIFVEMKIEWQTEGLRISPRAQRIYCSYNCENRITTISKLSQNYILVGDEMGTLRIFPYPPDSHRLGELHTSCYAQHMNKINSIKQHKELTYVATTAVYDRSLILWRKYGL